MKKTNCGVYNIINLAPDKITNNLKLYAGSSENLKSRKYVHFNDLKNNRHHCNHLQNAYNRVKEEYGEENIHNYFKFKPIKYLEKISNKELLKEYLTEEEQREINKYRNEDGSIDHDRCYNSCPIVGSRLGLKQSVEEKKKRSETFKKIGIKPPPEEKVKVINIDTKLEFCSIKEAAEFYSIKANSIGMVCNKQRKTAGGYRWEYLERCSNTRKKRDKNIIRKISANNAQKRKVINTDTREIFESIREASKCINIHPSNINNVCRGKRKLAGGYRWAYYTEITEL